MDAGIAAHLASTPLTTIGLFSVTHAANGSLRTGSPGYAAITGDVGRQVISEAHERGTRVEVVYSSFGLARNARLFGSVPLQDKVIAALVQFVGDVGADGVNVDVEALDSLLIPAYAGFLTRLRAALVAADPGDQVSVATQANVLGAAMAAGATEANVDRIFMMAYDYRNGDVRPGRDVADRPPGRRREGHPLVARPVRRPRRPPGEAVVGAPAVRRDVARGRARDRGAVARARRGLDPAQAR